MNTTNKEKPSDFDWVTVRSTCSALNMLQTLQLEAEQNVQTMKALSKAQGGELPLSVSTHETSSFAVMRRTYMGEKGVRFAVHGDEIRVEGLRVPVKLTALLTVNDVGECRFLVACTH